MLSNKLHNISRNKVQNCWQVRITRNGVERSKTFSDSKMPFGSSAVGLSFAMQVRDEMLAAPFRSFVRNY